MSRKKVDKVVFHYCANEKMISILNSKTIRLSDIAKSNDYNELQIFYPYIFDELEKAYSKRPWTFKYKKSKDINAFKLLLSDVDLLIREELFSGAITSFVTCFSGARDRLSQWRGYANDGKGGAIAFSVSELEALASKTDELRFVKVKYETRDGYKWKVTWEQVNMFAVLNEKIDNSMKESLFSILCYENINELLIDSLEYKNKDFEEEEEYRLFTTRANIKFSDEDILKKFENEYLRNKLKKDIVAEKLEFQIGNDNIVPFYPIKLHEISTNPIKEILLGPRNKIILSDLQLLLNNYGWNSKKIKTANSDISYRA